MAMPDDYWNEMVPGRTTTASTVIRPLRRNSKVKGTRSPERHLPEAEETVRSTPVGDIARLAPAGMSTESTAVL